VLDAALVAVGRGKNFFYRMIWDSLASRWSATYLDAVARGPARWSRELENGRAVDHDRARSGLNFDALRKAARNGYGL